MRFHTQVIQSGRTATGIEVPAAVVESLGAGRRPPVRVTLNGYSYRSTVVVMGGVYMVGLSSEHRQGSGVGGGDHVDVDIELDEAPREVTIPPELAAALAGSKKAQAVFAGLSYSNKLWHVLQVTGARSEETRRRRIAKSIETLEAGRPR